MKKLVFGLSCLVLIGPPAAQAQSQGLPAIEKLREAINDPRATPPPKPVH